MLTSSFNMTKKRALQELTNFCFDISKSQTVKLSMSQWISPNFERFVFEKEY